MDENDDRAINMKNICFKCMVGMIHPFHDNGKANPRDIQQFMGIDWFDEEREDKERIQDGG